MTDRVTIDYDGDSYDPFKPGEMWRAMWSRWTFEEAEHYRRVIIEGTIRMPDGEEMEPRRAKLVRARLLNTYADSPAPGHSADDEGRWLIPEVWRWGHKPMLSGQPRAGKSTLLADVVASLLLPGRRFLDHFEAADLTDDERDRGVWLINAENPEPELRDLIESVGLDFYEDELAGGGRYEPEDGAGWLMVDHLESLGGAAMFDLRVPEVFDWWGSRIMDLSCAVCDGRDEAPPLAVIVDGVTAILGSDTKAYGEWYAKFRDLMKSLDIPNALVVVHSPMSGGEAMNGVESIAQADGTWKYEMKNVHDHRSQRTFSGSRRLVSGGIPGGKVIVGDDGRLRIPDGEGETSGAVVPNEPASESATDSDVLSRLHSAGSVGLMTVEVTGRGKDGQFRRAALKRLVAGGLVVGRPEGKGRRWFLAEFGPPD